MGDTGDLLEWLTGRFGRTVRDQLRRVMAELESTLVGSAANDGEVRVNVNGRGKLISITVAPEMLNDAQGDRLQQLLVRCVQRAVDDAAELRQRRIVEALPGSFQPMAKEILLENP